MAVDNNIRINKSEGSNYDPIPESTYQVQIVDVKEVQRTTQWGVKDKFQFTCAVVDDEEYKGRLVFVTPTKSWFNGEGGKRASALFNLIKTIYAHYEPKTDVGSIDEISGEMINSLVGKQFIAIVKVNDKYNNISDYVKIKKPIEYEHPNKNGNEDINPEDVPL